MKFAPASFAPNIFIKKNDKISQVIKFKILKLGVDHSYAMHLSY